MPLPPLTGSLLAPHFETALPLLTSCLDDDNTETRLLTCGMLAVALDRLGAGRITDGWTRTLYPELLKRLDDASDAVRIKSADPIISLIRCFHYSSTYSAEANMDKTNYQYFLRGLLVHLDDPAPEIQQAASHSSRHTHCNLG